MRGLGRDGHLPGDRRHAHPRLAETADRASSARSSASTAWCSPKGGGIGTLVYEGLAATQKEAGALALAAGVDVGISFESGYMQDLLASVREGKVPMSLVDRSVRRILKQKFRLGLFEKPLVDPEHAVRTVHRPEHQDLALEAAREGDRAVEERPRPAAPEEDAAVDRRDRAQRRRLAQPTRRLRPAQDPPAHRHGAGRHPADRLRRGPR